MEDTIMKETYIKPTIKSRQIVMHAYILAVSADMGEGQSISEASPTDGPTGEDHDEHVDAWGDAKQWGWDFND